MNESRIIRPPIIYYASRPTEGLLIVTFNVHAIVGFRNRKPNENSLPDFPDIGPSLTNATVNHFGGRRLGVYASGSQLYTPEFLEVDATRIVDALNAIVREATRFRMRETDHPLSPLSPTQNYLSHLYTVTAPMLSFRATRMPDVSVFYPNHWS